MCGNNSLTHSPLCPRCLNSHGLPNHTRLALDCERFVTALSPMALPSCFLSIGFGSNVST